MQKLTLTFVGRYTTKKDGTPLVGKNGRPYTSLRIKANEYGDKFLSGFDGAETKSWKVGDTVEAEVEEKGEYLNFSVPKSSRAPSSQAVERLVEKIDTVNTNALRSIALIQELARSLRDSGVIKDTNSDGSPVPNFDRPSDDFTPDNIGI